MRHFVRIASIVGPIAVGILVIGVSCSGAPAPAPPVAAAPPEPPQSGDACVSAPTVTYPGTDSVQMRGEEPMERWYFLYSCDLPFGSVVVTVFPDGESSARLSVNLGERQEIGEYRRALTAADVEPLRAALRESGYADLPEAAPAPPGTPFVFLAEGSEGSPPVRHRSFPLNELPEPIMPVMNAMRPVIDAIREGPYRVVAGNASFVQPEYASGDDLVIDITLRNNGTTPVEIVNPAGALTNEDVGLLLRIARDKPDAELTDDDVAAVEFARDSVRLAPRPGVEFEQPGATIVLGTGEELRLRATKRLMLTAGRYKAVVTFQNRSDRIDQEAGAPGSLTLELGTVTIR